MRSTVAIVALIAASTVPLAAQQVSIASDTGAVHAAVRGIVQVLASRIADAAIAPRRLPWRVHLPDSGRAGWLRVRSGLVDVLRARAVAPNDREIGLLELEPIRVQGDSLFVSFLVGSSRYCRKRWTEEGSELTLIAVRTPGGWSVPVLQPIQITVDDFC